MPTCLPRQAAELRAERDAAASRRCARCPAVQKCLGQRGQHGAGARADSAGAFDGMKARKVLVKNVSTMHPLLANCLRLTVGTPEENAQMLAA
jgi:histidinol-phosphate aminotransferase